MTRIQLVLAFIVSLLDEAVIVALLLWGLPWLGIELPLPALAVIAVVLAIYAIVSFRLGIRALMKKPVAGLCDMSGSRGRVVSPLEPEGTVRIRGELWQAVSAEGKLSCGDEVIVVAQDRLKLTVRKVDPRNG